MPEHVPFAARRSSRVASVSSRHRSLAMNPSGDTRALHDPGSRASITIGGEVSACQRSHRAAWRSSFSAQLLARSETHPRTLEGQRGRSIVQESAGQLGRGKVGLYGTNARHHARLARLASSDEVDRRTRITRRSAIPPPLPGRVSPRLATTRDDAEESPTATSSCTMRASRTTTMD